MKKMKNIVLNIPVSKRKYGQRNRVETVESDQSRNVTHFPRRTRIKDEIRIEGNQILNQKPLLSFFRYGWN